ncbi:hypothetical protein HK103_002281 [Boothiomyces macroporosus]|uniref:Ankyrin repeat protein n=1 Tax=Boothiomyces macroporosus TaxID=261099 RepID=A0AAD5UIX0_9FUNG|nr:hypothetical protein HK103_002281 [Boothiomyces macroporosus]
MKVAARHITDWDSFATETLHYGLLEEFKRINMNFVSLQTKLELFQITAKDESTRYIRDEFYCQVLRNIIKEKFDRKLLSAVFSQMCKNKYVKSVEFLLAYIDPRNYELNMAASNSNVEIVKILLNDPRVNPGDFNNLAIRTASELGDAEIVQLLLQNRNVDPSVLDNAALRLACYFGNVKVASLLLQDPRVDPSSCDNEAIRKTTNSSICLMLMNDKRVDPTARNNEALSQAVKLGKSDIVEILLQDHRVDPTFNNYDFLTTALQSNDTATLEILLRDPRVDLDVYARLKGEHCKNT